MSLRNFQVARRITRSVAGGSLFAVRQAGCKRASRGGRFGGWFKRDDRLIAEQGESRLRQCRKPSREKLGCKRLFAKSEPKPECEASTAGDVYVRARQTLEARAQQTVAFIGSETRSIADDLRIRAAAGKSNCTAYLEELCARSMRKLDELIDLDVSRGTWVRREVLLLNNEITHSFEVLERAFAANARSIVDMLEKLQREVSDGAMRAKGMVTGCREHMVPYELEKCVKERLSEGTRVLDDLDVEARRRLKRIAELHERIVSEHERTARGVLQLNRDKAAVLSEYLERCIARTKKLSK